MTCTARTTNLLERLRKYEEKNYDSYERKIKYDMSPPPKNDINCIMQFQVTTAKLQLPR